MPDERGDQQLAKDIQRTGVAKGENANVIASSIKAEIDAKMDSRFFQLEKDINASVKDIVHGEIRDLRNDVIATRRYWITTAVAVAALAFMFAGWVTGLIQVSLGQQG